MQAVSECQSYSLDMLMVELTWTLAQMFIHMIRRELRLVSIFLFRGRIVEWKVRKIFVRILLRKRETIIKAQVNTIIQEFLYFLLC